MVVGVLCALVLALAYQATRTALALQRLKEGTTTLAEQVRRGDTTGARETARQVARDAATARAHSDNVLWTVAGWTPWIGGDFRAVRSAAAALDLTAESVLPTALQLNNTLGQRSLRSPDGRFDTVAISRLTPGFEALGRRLRPVRAAVSDVDASSLRVTRVRDGVGQLEDQLDSLATLASAGAKASRLLPGMLGARGPRSYLLIVQNSAEVRSTGGLPGSLLMIRTNGGKITLDQRFSAADFAQVVRPVVDVRAEERQLYGTRIARDVREANEVPDFPRVGQIVSGLYKQTYGGRIDGVLATDPVALSELMRVTGPVTVGSEQFTSADVVRKLLNTVYLRFSDPRVQDSYFAGVAKGVFDRLSVRPVNQVSLVQQLGAVARERRLLVWSRDAREQAVLSGTVVAGEVSGSIRGDRTVAGMYLNDMSAGKMGYYLDYTGGIRAVGCTGSGAQTFDSRLRLRSNAPPDASLLPNYIAGDGTHVRRGWMKLALRIYGPPGGDITAVTAGGVERRLPLFTHNGRPVAFLSLVVRPGATIEVVARMRTAAGAQGRPTVEWTPGIRRGATSISVPSACR